MSGVAPAPDRPSPDRLAPARRAVLVTTGVILVLAIWESLGLWAEMAARGEIGQDWRFYAGLGQRWLETGVLYGDRQLTGLPYHVLVNVDNLYPPPAILFFAPFAILPAPVSAAVWWVVPIAVVGLVVVRLRPRAWAWPLLAFGLFWPRTLGSLFVGNTDLWSAAFVAGGLAWGWPGALGLLKPSFGPLALVGIRTRWWWVVAGLLGLVSVPFVLNGDVADYATAVRGWDLPWHRSLPNVPIVLIPVVAWVARREDRPGGPAPERWPGQPSTLTA